MDSSRTQLGDKANEAYPLTWAEGDQVSVNGVASDALTAEEAGEATATFTFDGGLATPYCLAYPAAAAGQVEFPAVQNQPVFGNIENNVTVLYGYSADGKSVKLNHLTGLLKIGIKGSANLTYAQISTIDRAPIAGAFNLDFEKGTLTATESASEVITYNFIDGALSEDEAKYIYVSVPAGTYDELYVTLYDNANGVMYATVKAGDSKPLTAGNVREFSSDVVYEPMSTTDKFIIANYGDLVTFKQTVEAAEATLANADATDEEKAAATATLSKPAVFIGDVEVNGATMGSVGTEWSPINAPSYTGTVSGNGYAVNGLTQPLFNTTAATIKGVHLKGVAIASDYTSANTGALVNTYTGASISHCSAEGTITLTRETSVANKIGGLVGYVSNTTSNWAISDCVNNCAITVNLTQGATSVSTWVGGLVGDSYSGTPSLKVITIKNNTNKGAILVTGNTNATLVVGGIICRVNNYEDTTSTTTKDTALFTNCSNSANLSANLGTSAAIHMAGILAYDYIKGDDSKTAKGARYFTRATDCYNSGKIEVNLTGDSTATGVSCIGGCFGYLRHLRGCNFTLTNCDNSGDVVITSTGSIAGEYHIAGVVADLYGRITVSNCDNTGKSVKFNANTITGISSVGGVVGFGAVRAAGYAGDVNITRNAISLSKCTNSADVWLDVQQTMSNKAFIGGVIGLTYAHTSTYSTLTFTELSNYGNITVDVPSSTSTTPLTFVGGVMGSNWLSDSHSTRTTQNIFKITDCTNGEANTDKKIVIKGADNAANAVDGVMGYKDTRLTKTTVEGNTNNMAIEYNSATE